MIVKNERLNRERGSKGAMSMMIYSSIPYLSMTIGNRNTGASRISAGSHDQPPMISPSSRMNWTITSCSTLTRLELQLKTARELSTNPPTKSAIQSQTLRMTSTKSLMTSGLILLCRKSKKLSVSHANHGSGISPLASLYFQRSCFSQ